MDTMHDRLVIAGREFQSRLWVGTGKYKDFAETKKAIDASGADVVTVAVRRVNITDRSKENLLDYLDPKKYIILPNTAGCYTVEDAVRYARLARAAGVSDLVKLEVLGDEKTLFPDTAGLIEAAKILIKEGFIVLPYERRSNRRQEAGGYRLPGRHAARGSDRIWSRHPQSVQPEDHHGNGESADHRRCRSWNRIGCGAGNGIWSRCGVDEYRYCRGSGSDGYGGGDEICRVGRPVGL